MSISDVFVPVPGGRIFCKLWQPPAPSKKIPLVLLHDSLGCVAMWRDFPERLSQTLSVPVIAYDRLGFGASDSREGLPSLRFVAEEAGLYFPSLVAALDLQEFGLFGHSVGGSMAVHIAAGFPKQCRYVITESSQAFVEERTREGIRRAKADFDRPELFARLEKYHGAKAAWVLKAWTDTWLSPGFDNWNLKDALNKATCPLLAVHGDRDEYGSRAFPQTIVEETKGRAESFIVEDCGHIPHREKTQLILDRVRQFIQLIS